MPFPYEEFDLSGVRTYSLKERPGKVRLEDCARPVAPGGSLRSFLDGLPQVLGAADLRRAVAAMVDARRREGGIIWGLGAHVIKTGVSPVIIDLMERGYVSALALNGAGMIHDFEMAMAGGTSEDVDATLGPGKFGMAAETATLLNGAIAEGSRAGRGLGESVSASLAAASPPHASASLLVAAHRLGVPVTVHVALGTDIIHMHPEASGAATGDASLRDFRYFTSSVARLRGGVYLNCGSAVVLPEVFLKAVALARNQGVGLDGLTTINIDFVRMYRPQTNVVARPAQATGGVGLSLVGHHEILIPLLAAAIVEREAAGPEDHWPAGLGDQSRPT